jgi:hypothetical protein
MQSLSKNEQRQVLGEVLSDQLKAILEYVQEIPAVKRKLAEVDERLINVEQRLIVVEAVVKSHEADIRHIKRHLQPA